jgi:hypothetical protein
MTREEQNVFLSKEYAESNRYMDNAKETLRRAGRDGLNYTDRKYVRTACGTAYNGLLLAVDAWLVLKGVPGPGRKRRKSIEYYTDTLAQLDNKMLTHLKSAYDILHLSGYYDGITSVKAVEGGFDAAYWVIDKIKPENLVEAPETKTARRKRIWSRILISAAVMFMSNKFRY